MKHKGKAAAGKGKAPTPNARAPLMTTKWAGGRIDECPVLQRRSRR
ncbi:hypothetical protein A2U01_0114828, partial [Trifolium medium]|nr:hypothetical protein [Trifolium medium]